MAGSDRLRVPPVKQDDYKSSLSGRFTSNTGRTVVGADRDISEAAGRTGHVQPVSSLVILGGLDAGAGNM
jgi:hypothetical protein